MRFRIDLKILFFLGLFYLTKQLNLYIIVMLFAFLHECAHIFSAIILGFKIEYIELMPFGFFTKIQAKIDDYNIKIKKSNLAEFKKIFIALAGPISNLIFILVLYILNKFLDISKFDILVYSNLFLFLLNIIPIFPLDGGRVLNSIFKIYIGVKKANIYTHKISNIMGIVITCISSIMILYLKNIAILMFVIFIWELIHIENKYFAVKNKLFSIMH